MLAHLMTLDLLARAWVGAHRVEALNGVMWGLSAIGRGGILFALIGLALAIVRRRPGDFAQVAAAVLLASLVVDHVLKPAVHRARPFVAQADVDVIGGRPHDWSFPSGHAATAGAGATVLTVLAPRAAGAWWALAAAIAYSRIYLGVHYPGDVLGGILVGILSGAVVRALRRPRRE